MLLMWSVLVFTAMQGMIFSVIVIYALAALIGAAFGGAIYWFSREFGPGKKSRAKEPLDLVFVRNLLEREKGKAKGEYDLIIGYIHRFTIRCREAGVTIRVEYNDVRQTFSMTILADEVLSYLFDRCSQEAIQHVVRETGLAEDLRERLAAHEAKEQAQESAKQKLIDRYTQ